MKLPRNAKIFRGQLDAAPFAGMLFLLVIFLLLSSKMVFTPGVKVELPQVPRDLAGTANATLVVAVDAGGQLYYESQPISLESLPLRLKAFIDQVKEPVTLVVQADKSARMETVVPLLNVAREAGIQEVILPARIASISTKSGTNQP